MPSIKQEFDENDCRDLSNQSISSLRNYEKMLCKINNGDQKNTLNDYPMMINSADGSMKMEVHDKTKKRKVPHAFLQIKKFNSLKYI